MDSDAKSSESSKQGHWESWQLHLESLPAKKLILPSVEILEILLIRRPSDSAKYRSPLPKKSKLVGLIKDDLAAKEAKSRSSTLWQCKGLPATISTCWSKVIFKTVLSSMKCTELSKG